MVDIPLKGFPEPLDSGIGPLEPGFEFDPLPPYPTPPPPASTASCGKEKLCDCLGYSLAVINRTLQEIKFAILRKQKTCKDIANECINDIIDAINEKYAGAQKTCEECISLAKGGAAGTLEYALTCSHCISAKCDADCSNPSNAGKCCTGCGKEKCICKDYECVPADGEEEKEKPKKYIGWCDPINGIVLVTGDKDEPPGQLYQQVTLADTEASAFEEAKQVCNVKKYPQPRPDIPTISSGTPVSPQCNILTYSSGAALSAIASQGQASHVLGGIAKALTAGGRLGIDGLNIENIAEIIQGLYSAAVGTPPALLHAMAPAIGTLVGCDADAFAPLVEILGSLGIMEKFTGVDLSMFLAPYKYATNATCRQLHLDPDKAIAAYLSNGIDGKQLDAYWAVNGYCNPALTHYLQAAKSKPIPMQLSTMRHREIISASEYHMSMRELGYLDSTQREQIFNITYQVPTLTDIIRFMVRDADDNDLANRLGLDSFFDQKYRDQLKRWSKDQGIPDKIAQYAWRAHWQIPSPTQLFEFWHRLRYNQKFGGKQKLLDDIKAALIQQDILPYWHDHYLAVSFRPMTRVDLRRAFNIGSINQQQLLDGYLALGYEDSEAAKLVAFTIRLRDQAAVNHRAIKLWHKQLLTAAQVQARMTGDGIPAAVVTQAMDDSSIAFASGPDAVAFVRGDITRQVFINRLTGYGVTGNTAGNIAASLAIKITDHPAIKRYLCGKISQATATQQMTNAGMDTQVIIRLLQEASDVMDCSQAAVCQRGIRRRFLLGELDQTAARRELIQFGLDPTYINSTIGSWLCEKSAVGRAVPTAKLCDWLSRGIINGQQFVNRLVNIGYTRNDAGIILTDCLGAINQRRLAEARKIAKDSAAAAEKAARIQRQLDAAADREKSKREAQQAKAAKTRAMRQEQLLSAADKMHDKCACTLHAGVVEVTNQRDRLQTQYGLPIDDALMILIKAAETWDGGTPSSYGDVVTELAELTVAANLTAATPANLPV